MPDSSSLIIKRKSIVLQIINFHNPKNMKCQCLVLSNSATGRCIKLNQNDLVEEKELQNVGAMVHGVC
jgi:hypothetical protein